MKGVCRQILCQAHYVHEDPSDPPSFSLQGKLKMDATVRLRSRAKVAEPLQIHHIS